VAISHGRIESFNSVDSTPKGQREKERERESGDSPVRRRSRISAFYDSVRRDVFFRVRALPTGRRWACCGIAVRT